MEHLAVPELGSHPGFFSSTHAFNEIRASVEPADFAARVQTANKAAACKKGSEKAADLLFDQHW